MRTTKTSHYSNIGKDTCFEAQKKRVLRTLKKRPATMLMLSIETGILRANLCWYFKEFRKQNKVIEVAIKPCEISKHKAVYYSLANTLF